NKYWDNFFDARYGGDFQVAHIHRREIIWAGSILNYGHIWDLGGIYNIIAVGFPFLLRFQLLGAFFAIETGSILALFQFLEMLLILMISTVAAFQDLMNNCMYGDDVNGTNTILAEVSWSTTTALHMFLHVILR
ncbi:hypothetical protein ACJX0J_017571, partial [Zea mays]